MSLKTACSPLGSSAIAAFWMLFVGDNGVVIRDLLPIDDLLRMNRNTHICSNAGFHLNSLNKSRQHTGHVLGEIAAIGSRIRHQLFLIEGLGVIQRLLCSEAQHSVGISLQAG